MLTSNIRTAFLLFLSATAWAATTTVIDDDDSRFLYSGTWTKNPINDPQMLNYHGTLTFTNDTTASATFSFSGAIQIQVFGAFPVAGTFAMHSAYSIDGAAVMQFEPPSVIGHPAYHQQFFISNTLSTGTHKLVIANRGQAYYLDYVQLILPAAPSSIPTQGPVASAPPQSASPASPGTIPTTQPVASTTVFVITQGAPTTTLQTTKGSTTSVTSIFSSNVGDPPASSSPVLISSSTDAPGSTSSPAEATQSGERPATPTGTSLESEAHVLSTGLYVGIGVGGFTVVVLVFLGIYFLCRRRRRRSIANNVNPFVVRPGQTPLASALEKSQLPARAYAYVNRISSTTLSTSHNDVGPYAPAGPADSSSHAASEGHELHVVPGERRRHSEKALYEHPAFISVVSPPAPGHLNGQNSHRDALLPTTSSPVSPDSNLKRARLGTNWRRSLDGGVRLAGGPSGTRRDADMADVDARSAMSTLPPMYDSYSTA